MGKGALFEEILKHIRRRAVFFFVMLKSFTNEKAATWDLGFLLCHLFVGYARYHYFDEWDVEGRTWGLLAFSLSKLLV